MRLPSVDQWKCLSESAAHVDQNTHLTKFRANGELALQMWILDQNCVSMIHLIDHTAEGNIASE